MLELWKNKGKSQTVDMTSGKVIIGS